MNETKYSVPVVAMNERPETYEYMFELPGVAKGEVALHVENRTLDLKTTANYQAPAGFKQVVGEFDRVNYATRVDLPETADTETVAAKFENGVLRVTVQKRPETQARTIAIA